MEDIRSFKEFLQLFTGELRASLVIRAVGYGLVIATVIGLIVCIVQKRVVSSILKAGSISRDTSKTAKELSLTGPFSKLALRDRSTLRKTVMKAPSVEESEEARFYIPEEGALKAEMRYVKKTSPIMWAVGAALLIAATEAAVRIVPWTIKLF